MEIMNLTDITSMELINLELTGNTKLEIIDEMILMLEKAGMLGSAKKFKKAIIEREKEGTTGLGMDIAIPHGKSKAVIKPSVVFGIKSDGVDWESLDDSLSKLIFMIAVPESQASNTHLKILQMLARKLMDEDFRTQLLNVKSKEEAFELLETIR